MADNPKRFNISVDEFEGILWRDYCDDGGYMDADEALARITELERDVADLKTINEQATSISNSAMLLAQAQKRHMEELQAQLTKLEAQLAQTERILANTQLQRDEAYRQRDAAQKIVTAAVAWYGLRGVIITGSPEIEDYYQKCHDLEMAVLEFGAKQDDGREAIAKGKIPEIEHTDKLPQYDPVFVRTLWQAYSEVKAAQQWEPVEDEYLHNRVNANRNIVLQSIYKGQGIVISGALDGEGVMLPDGLCIMRKVQP